MIATIRSDSTRPDGSSTETTSPARRPISGSADRRPRRHRTSVAARRDPAEPVARATPRPLVLDLDGASERRDAVRRTVREHDGRAKEVLEPRDSRIDHGVVFLDVRDLLGYIGAHEPAGPAHAIGKLARADGAKAVELLLVLGVLGSADDELGRRAVGAMEGCDRFVAHTRGRRWMSWLHANSLFEKGRASPSGGLTIRRGPTV